MDTITYNTKTYTAADMVSVHMTLGESLTAAGLSVDTLEAELKFDSPPSADYGAPVVHSGSGRSRTFYLTGAERTGTDTWRLTAVSEIGLLDGGEHRGGIYNGLGGSLAPEVIADIIGGAFPFEVDSAFADTALYGWLPMATRRDNLRQVLFAIGASVRRNDSGIVRFAALSHEPERTIGPERIYSGGKWTNPTPAAAVNVTEHSYTPDYTEKRLYSGETHAQQLIRFGEPCHSLRCEGAEIVEWGANWAVLTPSPGAELFGCGYDHGKRIYTLGDTGGRTVSVNDCTLVSMANSASVARRVLAYHSSPMDVTQDFAEMGERPGDRVHFADPFGGEHTGYIKSMELQLGALSRAEARFDTGYLVTGVGNTYTDCMTVTSSGRVTLPDAERVRLVLIGGGSGGQGGMPGESGHQPDGSSTTSTSMTEIVLKSVDSGVWRSPEGDDNYYYWYESAEGRYDLEYGGLRVAFRGLSPLLTIPQAYAAGYMYREVYENGVRDRKHCYVMQGTGTYEGDPMYFYSILEPEETTVPTSALRKYYTTKTDGGYGGEGGAAGASGKVYQIDLDITPGAAMNVTIGSGGTGGSASGEYGEAGAEGTSGGDTTVTIGGVTITSADGVRLKTGYTNIMDGKKYALPAENGIRGGDGGAYTSHDVGEKGGDVGNCTGGAVGETKVNSSYGEQRYAGGSGGGASATANGSKGGSGNASSTSTGTSTTGAGGAGASASKPQTQQSPGSGGHGGHGGGGGGNAGGSYDARPDGRTTLGAAGTGGAGGSGGDGAGGVLLIYYGAAPKAMGAVLDADGNALIGSDGAAIQTPGGYTSKHRVAAIDDFVRTVLNG